MKRHSFDGLSFIAGLVFTGMGLAFLLLTDLSDLVEVFTDAGSWFWAVLLIAVGVAIVVPALSRRDDDTEEGQTDDASGL